MNRRIPGRSYFTIVQYWTEVHREVRYDSTWGRTREAGVPATTSKDIYHGMLSPPPGPLRFRRECEDRWDRQTTESVHHAYPAGRLRAYTTTLGVNEIACGLVSALIQIHEPQCQLRFNPT